LALSLNLLSVCFEIANPFLIKLLIEFISDPSASLSTGIILGIFYVVSNFLFNITMEQATFYQMQFGVKAQTAVRGLIYEKSLKLSPATNKEFSQGDIINFI